MSAVQTRRNSLVGAIRLGSATVVVATSVAVTALSLRGSDTITIVVPQGRAATVPSAVVQPSVTVAQPVPPAPPVRAVAGPAPAAVVALAPRAAASVPIVAKPAPAAGPQSSVALAPGLAAALAQTDQTPQPACPLGLPAPTEQGGLASLIGLAPLAGPFSSEAFAFGAVYQPILRLVGPILAQIQPALAAYQPLIDPVIARVQGVEEVVLDAILPFYGPFRPQLIAAEGGLAAVLAPILEQIYHTPAASCLVAWEGQMIAAAKGGPMTVALPAQPGSVVVLRPTH